MSARPRLPSPDDPGVGVIRSDEIQAYRRKKQRVDAEELLNSGTSRDQAITIDDDFTPSRLLKKTQSRVEDFINVPKKEKDRFASGFRMASGSKLVVREMRSVVSTETAVVKPVRHIPSPSEHPRSPDRDARLSRYKGRDKFGNRTAWRNEPLRIPRPLGANSAYKTPMLMDDEKNAELEGDTEKMDEDDVLIQSDPVLKAMDKNVIEMIKSEIIVLDLSLTWDDVVGLENAKRVLREIIILPFKRPDVFKGIRAPPKGVLLFGPPGTGKTMIGRCVANQCKATFFNISASALTSKWVGEGEKLVRALFRIARLKEPSVIFIDELDSLLSTRRESEHESSRRIKTELLVQMDGVCSQSGERLLVLAATNKPQELDEAARRRFAKRLYIALPTVEARCSMLKKHLSGLVHDIGDDSLSMLAEQTDGFSGADMRQLCCEAAMGPIREIDDMSTVDFETVKEEEIRPISVEDFEDALRSVKRTVLQSELDGYLEWDDQFGCSKLYGSAQNNASAKPPSAVSMS